jgi:hypothetical protein
MFLVNYYSCKLYVHYSLEYEHYIVFYIVNVETSFHIFDNYQNIVQNLNINKVNLLTLYLTIDIR